MRYLKSLLLVGAMLAAPFVSAQDVHFDFSNEYNPASIHAEGDEYFIEQVKKLTGGSVDITLHTGGSLGYKSIDHFYAVSDDAVQLADTFSPAMVGVDPIFLLSSLPFLVKNPDQAELLYQIAKPYYQKIFADNNEILLYASPWPASGIWSKQPATSKESIAGLKIRTYDKNSTLTMKNAGAAPVNLSWADVVPQLSTGGIDAVLTSADAGASSSFWEHLKNYSAIQYAIPLNMVHMNKDEFDGLDADQQKAILEAAVLTDKHNWAAVRTRVVGNYKDLEAHQVAIHDKDLPPAFLELLETAAKPTLQDWLKETGDEGKTIIAQFNERK